MGRPWSSPRGNLYATLLLIDPAPQSVSPQLGFVAGLAVSQAVNAVLPGPDARIKWPNDLLIAGAKVAGLLVEATTSAQGAFVCAIGFGVNCASAPAHTPYPATCLAAAGSAAGPASLFDALSGAVPRWLEVWNRGAGFPAVRAAWLERALPPGSALQVRAGDSITRGAFSTIDAHGRLVLDCAGNMLTFDAGDVFPAGPSTPPAGASG